jgi:hypothetical protein
MGYLKYQKQWFSLSDYLDFMVRLQEKVPILPPEITIAVTLIHSSLQAIV